MEGRFAEGVELIQHGIAKHRATGSLVFVPWYLLRLSTAYSGDGRPIKARRVIEEALLLTEHTGDRWCKPDLLRALAELQTTA
jgi:hypothetical protein